MPDNNGQSQTSNMVSSDKTTTQDPTQQTVVSNQQKRFNIKWLMILPVMFIFGLLSTTVTLYLLSLRAENNTKDTITQLSQEIAPTVTLTLIPELTESPLITQSPTESPSITKSATPTKFIKPTLTRSGAYYYNNPGKPIDNIFITIVYFIPKGVQPDNNWQEGLKRNILAVKSFYERELSNKVVINYNVHPEYILASNDYNLAIPNTSPDYEQGCSSALNSAMSEIKPKIKISSGGDLNLWAVVFESLNCSIAPDNNLLVPGYVVDHAFEPDTPQMPSGNGLLLGHEFGHLLGIPDSYNRPEDYIHNNVKEPFCDIISHCQGDGKFRSLDQSFLSDKNKKALGVI